MFRSVIELDLVLAGLASTGAYGAGALDFIRQAIACLDAARQADPEGLPGPAIRLKPRGVAPAGRLNAALASNIRGDEAHENLHALWVNRLDPRDALRPGTASAPGAPRLFDPDCLARMDVATAVPLPQPSPAAEREFVVLIDPMRDALPENGQTMSSGAASLFLGGTEPSSAFTSGDIAYWICPARSHRSGVSSLPALSATIFDGFGGYLDARFRDHDFQLGRRNAQWALARHLTLPSDDPLVSGWSADLDRRHGVWPVGVAPVGAAPRRPLIPLVGAAAQPCPLPAWPQIESRALRKLEPLIAARIEHIAQDAAKRFLGDSFWTPVAAMVISGHKRRVARETRETLEQALAHTHQLAPASPRGLKSWFSPRRKPA